MIYLLLPALAGLLWLLILRMRKSDLRTNEFHTKSDLAEAQAEHARQYRNKQRFPIRYLLLPAVYLVTYYAAGLKPYLVVMLAGWVLFSVCRIFPSKQESRKPIELFYLMANPLIFLASWRFQSLEPLKVWLSIVYIIMLCMLIFAPKQVFGENTESMIESGIKPRLWFFPVPIILLALNEYLRINASDEAWLWYNHFSVIGIMVVSVVVVPVLVIAFLKD